MATIGSLIVDIRTNTSKFVQGMQKAQTHLDKIDRRVRQFSIGLKGLAGLWAAFKIAGFVQNTIAAGDQINKLHDRLGASTEALSQYQYVAEKTGVSFQTLTLGWQRMTRRVSEAAKGTGEATGALRELGLSAEKLNQLAPEQQFEAIAGAMEGVSNQADKVRIAMKLFDTDGVALVQTMGEGTAGLQKMREEANNFNRTISQDQANAMSIAQNAMADLHAATGGLATAFAVGLAPAITDLVNWLSTTGIPAFSNLLEKIGLIDRAISSLSEQETVKRMQDVTDQIKAITDSLQANPNTSAAQYELDQLTKLGQKYQELSNWLDQLHEKQKTPPPPPDVSSTSGASGFTEEYIASLQKRYDALNNELASEYTRMQQHYNDLTATAIESYAAGLTTYAEYQASMSRIAQLEAQNQINIEKNKTDLIRNMNQNVWQAAAGFLQTFAGESQAAAIAVIAIEKGLAIAQAVMNTAVAVTKALAIDPTGLLAARVTALGKIQIGLIAATGLAQAANVGSGGAAPGTPANPINTQPASSNLPESLGNRGAGTVVNITITGNQYGYDDFQSAVSDAVSSAISDDILVLSNS